MKVTKRIFYSIIFTSSLLVLGACGDEDNVDLSEASSVDEDTVTSEYYDEMKQMLSSYTEYVEAVRAEGVKYSTIEEESKHYLLLINSLDLIPISKVDKELNTYVFDFIIESELAAEYMLDYSTSWDISDKLDAEDYINDTIKTFDMIKEIIYKYDLQ